MDPVGPWSAYASYNRLAGVQASAASGDFHHHLASGGTGLGGQSVPSTTSQLLLQAAHTTASLAGQLGSSTASPFNPGGFLSPPAGYDAVFSPLFHHANPKPAHYSSSLQAQHRQVIAQAQAAAASKQTSVESELSSLRENYSHQTLAAQGSSFFDQSSTPGAAGLNWQGNNQLPSPFGILPHESVVPSSPSPATTKASGTFQNFDAHFAAAQTLNNHLNSQISSAGKQANRSASPAAAPKQPASSTSSTFFQSPSFGNQTDNYSTSSAKSGQLSSQQDYAGKQRANSASSVAPSSQQANVNSGAQDAKMESKKFGVPTAGPGAGFMASYLKFLQGERDTSPPPAGRGARKSTWSRTGNGTNNKGYPPNDLPKNHCEGSPGANGAMGGGGGGGGMPLASPAMGAAGMSAAAAGLLPSHMHSASNLLASQAKGLEMEDPRFYNLNKDRKRKYEEEGGASAGGYDAEEEARRLKAAAPVLNVPLADKAKKGRTTPQKSAPPAAAVAPQPARKLRAPQPAPPLQAPPQHQYYYQAQPEEATQSTNLSYGLYEADSDNSSRKLHEIKSHPQVSSTSHDGTRPMEEMTYQSGEFIALKNEVTETSVWPSLWRVDGKTLLQKYEPFEENGKVLYRNISTYTVWNPENKTLYTQVQVKIRTQTHLETIVELVRSEMPADENGFIEKRMFEWQMYQENFEVYIQTLISHALDPNFLSEIFQEQDDYFLSNVKTVDEVTETMRNRVSSGEGNGVQAINTALGTWPGLSIAVGTGTCRACARPAQVRLLLYGQPYNPHTLEPVQPDAMLAYEKEFLVCQSCSNRVQMYSRIAHQKYLMYAECSKRVAEKRMHDPRKDTTVILNELLADELWLTQLFQDVRQSWAEAEAWERRARSARQM